MYPECTPISFTMNRIKHTTAFIWSSHNRERYHKSTLLASLLFYSTPWGRLTHFHELAQTRWTAIRAATAHLAEFKRSKLASGRWEQSIRTAIQVNFILLYTAGYRYYCGILEFNSSLSWQGWTYIKSTLWTLPTHQNLISCFLKQNTCFSLPLTPVLNTIIFAFYMRLIVMI